jgi:hypothetical protein
VIGFVLFITYMGSMIRYYRSWWDIAFLYAMNRGNCMHFVFLPIDSTHAMALREVAALLQNDYGVDVAVHLYHGPFLTKPCAKRLAQLNPHATDEATLAALRAIYDDLEDRLEGVGTREVTG